MDIVDEAKELIPWLEKESLIERMAKEIERLRADNKKFEMIISKLLGKMAADEIAKNLLDHGVFIRDTE